MKKKLVVVGNGMAGARAVEELLARGGPEQFDVAMFGDEPYGNYNRILLSNILSGAQNASEIFINPLDWYGQNGIRLHAGARVSEIDRAAKVVVSDNGIRERYDKLLIATGSRAFIPPMAGVNGPDGRMKPGVFGFRTIDDCNGIMAQAKQSARAAVIGGGLLGLEAARGLLNHGCEVHVVHLAGHLMEMQLDASGGAILKASMEAMGVNVHLRKLTTDDSGRGQGHRARLQGRQHARLRHGRHRGRHQAECGDRVALRAHRRARHRRRQSHALGGRSRRLCGRRMRAAPRPRLRPGGAAVGAGEGFRRPHHRPQRRRRLSRLEARDQAQGHGRRARLDGDHRAGRGARRDRPVHRAQERHLQEADRARRPAGRRHPDGRHQQGRLPDAVLRPRRAAARRAAVAVVRSRHAEPEDHARRDAGRHAGVQLQRRHQGRDRCLRGRRQAQHAGGDGRDPRRQGLRLVQGAGRRAGRVALRRRGRGGPLGPLLRAVDSAAQARAGHRRSASRGSSRCRRCSRRWPAASRTQRASRRWRRCSSPSGTRPTRTSATRASSTTASTPTSRRTAPSPSFRRCRAASARRRSCGASPMSR